MTRTLLCAALLSGATVPVLLAVPQRARSLTTRPATMPASQPSAATPSPFPYRGQIDRFISRLSQGQVNEAIDELGFASLDEDKRTKIQRGLSTFYGVVGKCRGDQIVALTAVSASLQRVDVLAHYDTGVALFRLTFWHRPGDNPGVWQVIGYKVLTDTDDILKDCPSAPVVEPLHIPTPANR